MRAVVGLFQVTFLPFSDGVFICFYNRITTYDYCLVILVRDACRVMRARSLVFDSPPMIGTISNLKCQLALYFSLFLLLLWPVYDFEFFLAIIIFCHKYILDFVVYCRYLAAGGKDRMLCVYRRSEENLANGSGTAYELIAGRKNAHKRIIWDCR